jgi:6-phosphofructokinase 1
VFKAHDIRYFLYNGGNDSADTALKVSQLAQQSGYELTCVAVPKTVDNDLVITDCCPGFGSAARYTAVSVQEAAIDVEAMAETSTKVFVYEVMGRHAGWLAAAAGLAGETAKDAPHIILFPERTFDKAAFMAKVKETVRKVGYCVVVVSEGVKTADGHFLAEAAGSVDAFGHSQLGGAAPLLAGMVKDTLGMKVHWAVPDYLQRSGRHLASQVDLDQAMAVGKAAVELALAGNNGVMPAIIRSSDAPYRWHIDPVPLSRVANHEKKMPDSFIRKDGFGITAACRKYLSPLIQGQAPVPLGKNGLPVHFKPKLPLVKKKLKAWLP